MKVIEPNIGRVEFTLTYVLGKTIKVLSEAFQHLFKKYNHIAFRYAGEGHLSLALISSSAYGRIGAAGLEKQCLYTTMNSHSGNDSLAYKKAFGGNA